MGNGDYPINLPEGLNFEPDPARVAELAALIVPETWHLGRPWSDREAWDRVRSSDAGRILLEQARACSADEPRAYITNEDCLYVMKAKDRTRFDPLPLRVRSRLALLPIAECLEPTGSLLPKIEDDIRRLCALNSWTFPLHPDAEAFYQREKVFTDLASVHFAGNLVAALHLLGDRLSPEVRTMIRDEVETRIFKPFEAKIRSGKNVDWWTIVTHNWNSVCLAGVLSCALKLKESPEERAWYLAVVEKLIRHSEDGFEPGGFYPEGVGYWVYGFSHYVVASEMATAVTGGRLDWLKKPRVEEVSHFSYRMEIQEGAYPTFADCKRDVQPPRWLMHWMNNRIDPDRPSRATTVPIHPFDPIHFQFAEVLHLLLFHQMDINHAWAGEETRAIRDWWEEAHFLISRPGAEATTRMAATFKGGDNGPNHNHNDLGTFTVLMGGVELLTDPGAEIYDERTFSKRRYESNLLNSFGHPVPVVGGQLQFPDKTFHRTGFGRDAYTTVVDTAFSAERDQVILDMDRAYKVPNLLNLTRAFTYSRTGDGSVEVSDLIKFTERDSYETALITYADWVLLDDGAIRISAEGEAVLVRVSSDDGELLFAHCVIEESSTPTRLSWRFREPVLEATIRIVVEPAE